MKSLSGLFTLVCMLVLTTSFGQDFLVITNPNDEHSTKPTKSFQYHAEVILKPGFTVSASAFGTNGWYCRRRQIVNVPGDLTKNFIRTETILKDGIKNESSVPDLNIGNRTITYAYTDGIGRTTQSVAVESSPTQSDRVDFSMYDAYGRQAVTYLPYSVRNLDDRGAFRRNASGEQKQFYTAGAASNPPAVVTDPEPFGTTTFDGSPMNQPIKTYGPGYEWHFEKADRPVASRVKVNAKNEVRRIIFNKGTLIINDTAYVKPNLLTVSETTNEERFITRTFTNFRGQTLLERKGDGSDWNDTYFIYDAGGNLKYVFPPECVAQLFRTKSAYFGKTQQEQKAFLDLWTFQFKYDKFGRCNDKRVPGSGWVTTVYDSWDRPVMVQDTIMRLKNQWLFTKYDIHNRAIITGFVSGTRVAMENGAAAATIRYETNTQDAVGYTNKSFPPHKTSDLLSITYYDDYRFISNGAWEGQPFGFVPMEGFSDAYAQKVKGSVTGTKIRQLGSDVWLNSVSYFDDKYQPIQVHSENHLGGVDIINTLFDFSGKTVRTMTNYVSATRTVVLQQDFEYDHAGRLLKTWHQINDGPKILMTSCSYNELGELIEKNIHSIDNGTKFLQSVDMRYSIRGWINKINNSTLLRDGVSNDDSNDLFGMEVLFNDPSQKIKNGAADFDSRPMYDGNVSAVRWKMITQNTEFANAEKIYGFSYDPFSRFKGSYYATNNGAGWIGDAGAFNETVGAYDKNGNVGSSASPGLSRKGFSNGSSVFIDKLTYRYSGNQLKNVLDSENALGFKNNPGVPSSIDEYSYYENGNLKVDLNKNISLITYNHLNLPTEIRFTRADNSVDRIEYAYDAAGRKLQKKVSVNNSVVWTTDYHGMMQLDNGQISFISTPEGRAVNSGKTFEYEYFYRDHQGNVRVVYGDAKETFTYRATMETSMAATEEIEKDAQTGFHNVLSTRIPTGSTSLNYTPASEKVLVPNRSAKCNARTGQVVGPGKVLRIASGDAVYMEVFTKYTQPTGRNDVVTSAVLGAAVNAAFSIKVSDVPALFNSINANAIHAASNASTGNVVPKAYLAYLFFDENNVFQRAGAVTLSTAAYNQFEKLSRSFSADKNGYLYIYVASESNVTNANVYFDEMYIVHQKTNNTLRVFQTADYYPFGLSFNETQSDRLGETSSGEFYPLLRNRILFQGQELSKDLELGWYQYKYRMHDPAVGRFTSIDPLSEKYFYNSTYAFSENKLIHAVELEGLESSLLFELQKRYSPIAINLNYTIGSHFQGVGAEISLGMPKSLPFSYRVSYGKAYGYDPITKESKWQSKSGKEFSMLSGLISSESTSYSSGADAQTLGAITVGTPLMNIRTENDWIPTRVTSYIDPFHVLPENLGDGGDRFRTGALNIRFGLFNTGAIIGTGDPGPIGRRKIGDYGGTGGTYEPQPEFGYSPDRYRLGIGYVGLGGFRMGLNSESIRHTIQNRFIHDFMLQNDPSPWFRVMPSNPEPYLQYSTGTAGLWW